MNTVVYFFKFLFKTACFLYFGEPQTAPLFPNTDHIVQIQDTYRVTQMPDLCLKRRSKNKSPEEWKSLSALLFGLTRTFFAEKKQP